MNKQKKQAIGALTYAALFITGIVFHEQDPRDVRMIPAEAVEAAAKAYINVWSVENFVSPREYAEAMLEAAAPYLMRAAWDEATNALYMGNAINQDHLKTMWAQNPYRLTVE